MNGKCVSWFYGKYDFRSEGNMIDNKMVGVWMNYMRTTQNGNWELTEKQEYTLLNNNEVKYSEWYPNGQQKAQEFYIDYIGNIGNHQINGTKNGLFIYWHENGQKRAEEYYIKDNKDGVWTEWYENGQKKSECKYRNDNYEGVWTYWYENGNKEEERKHMTTTNGEVHITVTTWGEDGKNMEKEKRIEHVQNGLFIKYHSNGKKEMEGNYVNGSADGLWQYWYPNGNKESVENYENGEREGIATSYWPNGNKKTQGTYTQFNKTGTWISWFENGKKSCEQYYIENKIIKEVCWDKNGKKEK